MKSNYILFFLIAFISTTASAQIQTLSFQVSQSSDDAEESEDASETYINSTDLELVFDDFSDQNNQTVGIRFTNITIPQNATILSAYIQFHADDTGDIQTDLIIKGEAAAASLTFGTNAGNISSRNTTTQAVDWPNVPAWNSSHLGGVGERTPDLSVLINEMITNNGWTFGNPLSFIITGTGSREAEAFDGIPAEAPILVVEFSVPQADYDLGISEIQGVEDFMFAEIAVPISAVVKNQGLNPIDSFAISYSLNGGEQATNVVYETIAPGAEYAYTFPQTVDLLFIGMQTLEVEVSTENDGTDFNDLEKREFEVVADFSNITFGTSSVWKYMDDGADLGTDWLDLNYDDEDWRLGAGQFGFGDADEDIWLNTGNVTYYFRKLINVFDINSVSTVVANLMADDAMVLYVNGQEVARTVNLPTGPITAGTTPDRDVPHDFENHPVEYTIPVSYFNTGLNSIAVEVHNLSSNDIDLSFSCAFTNQPTTYSVDGPYVIYKENELLIKNITEDGLVVETAQPGDNPLLTCDLPNGDSFSFNLKNNHEIPAATYELPEKFLVTSDIEGQIEAYIYLLQGAGVIDENYNWTYGDGHLYFIGDMFDRGNYVTQCLWLLYKLEQEALLAGGEVHFIVGNHEVLNFVFDYRYVQDKYFENAHYMGEMLYDLFEANTELGRWLRSKNILENAGNSAIFVHAGLSPQVESLNLTYEQINDYGRLGMDDNCPSGNNACEVVNGGSDEGVYWYRGIADQEVTQSVVDNIVTSFDGETMIFGHTVFPQVTPLYQQKVIVVDVDHGDNYADGYMEALYFEEGCYYRLVVNAAGTSTTLLDPTCGIPNAITPELQSNLAFTVNPSLFSEELRLDYSAEFVKGNVLVYNAAGALLKTIALDGNQQTINTTDWASGTYLITVQSGKQRITRKVVKG